MEYRYEANICLTQGTTKPLVAGSNPAAATNKHKSSLIDQGITQIPQAYPHVNSKQGLHPGGYIKRNGIVQPFSAFGIVVVIAECSCL